MMAANIVLIYHNMESTPPPFGKMGDNFIVPWGTLNFNLPLNGGLAKLGF